MAVIKAVSSKAGIGQALDYVTKEEKTEDKLVSGLHCEPDTVKDEMQATKELWGKTGGRTYKHFVHSYHEDEHITPEQAHKNAIELAKGTEAWKGHEVLIATHIDRGHIHTHFIVNSVNYENGHKLQWSKADLQNLKDRCNEQSRQQGLHVPEKGKTFSGEEREETVAWNKETYNLLKQAEKGEVKSYVQAPSGFSLGFDLKPHISTDFAKNRPFILFPELRGIVLSALFLWLVAHLLHCFVQGVPGLKPSCISLGYWDIVEVQMGACFVHMDISPYELQIRVSFLEALYILHKGFFGSLPHLWLLEVLFTAPLHHILIEQLFAVLRLLDVVAVVLYLSVSSFLLCVVLLQSFTEDFLIGLLYILIDQSDVLRAFGDINVVWDRLTYLLIFSSVMELATFTLWH